MPEERTGAMAPKFVRTALPRTPPPSPEGPCAKGPLTGSSPPDNSRLPGLALVSCSPLPLMLPPRSLPLTPRPRPEASQRPATVTCSTVDVSLRVRRPAASRLGANLVLCTPPRVVLSFLVVLSTPSPGVVSIPVLWAQPLLSLDVSHRIHFSRRYFRLFHSLANTCTRPAS